MRSLSVACALVIACMLFHHTVAQVDCTTFTSCTTCVPTTGCGWCASTKKCTAGSSIGPSVGTCNTDSQFDWFFQKSQIVSVVNGFPVSPAIAEIYLKPNEPLTITITVTPPESDTTGLDLYFMQDASQSFSDDKLVFSGLVPTLINEVIAFQKDAYFGLGSFEEKPILPQGIPDNFLNESNVIHTTGLLPLLQNWEYRNEVTLTSDFNAIQTGVDGLVNNGNFDRPESSLSALMYTAVCSQTGWRDDSRHVVVLSTDADYHTAGSTQATPCIDSSLCLFSYQTDSINAGDASGYYCKYCESCPAGFTNSTFCKPGSDRIFCAYSGYKTSMLPGGSCSYTLPANNGDCVLATSIYGGPGSGEDYPTVTMVKQKLQDMNVVPVFAVTNDEDNLAVWGDLVDQLGFGFVTTLAADSSNLVQLIIAALADIASTIVMSESSDPQGYASTPIPTQYTDAQVFTPYTFTITLDPGSSPVVDNTIVFTALGFGKAELHIHSTLPCWGCDGVVNSNTVHDLCSVCNGTNACVSCNGGINTGEQLDICGVCGGNGESCLGCDGVKDSGLKFDDCGVCNGDNSTCHGCDGVAFSGLELDLCGVCNGSNACFDCFGVKFGTSVVDDCGVCNGTNACNGCDGVPFSGLVNDACGDCNGDDTCVGCDGVAFSGKVIDQCGVCSPLAAPTNSCVGCDGVPFSSAGFDQCGICGGTNTFCTDCMGVINGTSKLDACGQCDGTNACKDCLGVAYGTAKVDACGVCNGDNACVGCDGVPNSGLQADSCNVCNGDNACLDCSGTPYGTKDFDVCDVCGGTNACLDCESVPFGTKVVDQCGVCGGDGTGCLGCDGVVNSGKSVDTCGTCGGNNKCVDCLGVQNGLAKRDRCGVCEGTNQCVGCDGVIEANDTRRAQIDDCGVCSGNNSCYDCAGNKYGTHVIACGLCLSAKQAESKQQCGTTNTTVSTNITDVPSQSNPAGSPILEETTAIAVGIAAGGMVVLVGGAAAGFFIYKRVTKGKNWYIPDAFAEDAFGKVESNPFYEQKDVFKANPLFEESAGPGTRE